MVTDAQTNTDRERITSILGEIMGRWAVSDAPFRIVPVFDDASHNYLLLDEGWDGYKRIHRVWLHSEIKDGKI